MKESSLVFGCFCTLLGMIGFAAAVVVMHGLPVVIAAFCFALAAAAFAWSLYGHDKFHQDRANRRTAPLFCVAVGLAVLSNFSFMFWQSGLPPPLLGARFGQAWEPSHAWLAPVSLALVFYAWWRIAIK